MWLRNRNYQEELQLFLVSTLAVTTAWVVGSQFNKIDGLVAAIITIVTLKISLQASLSEGFIQLIGAGIGVATSLTAISLIEDKTLSVAVVTALSFIAAKVLRLGEAGVINIVITALIVLGPGLPTENAMDRTFGTLLGIATALVFSFIAHPTNPVTRTNDQVSIVMRKTSRFIASLAETLNNKPTQTTFAHYLKESRILHSQLNLVRNQAEEAVLYAKWSPLAPSKAAEAAYMRFTAAEHIQVQVRNIARTLYDYSIEINDKNIKSVLISLLHSTATILNSENPTTNALYQLKKEMRSSYLFAKKLEGRKMITTITILTAIERIHDSLQVDNPAISQVPTPLNSTTPYAEMKKAFTLKKGGKDAK